VCGDVNKPKKTFIKKDKQLTTINTSS